MRIFISILLSLFVWTNVSAQKSPYHLRNYTTAEYRGFNQTWQVLQDENGLIFLASTSSIFTYDGVVWNSVPVKRGAATRQIYYDSTSSTIYVGSVQEFGCLEHDSTGKFVFRSFMDQLQPDERIFSDIWKIHQIGKQIYFQSAEHIFVVEGKKVVGRIDPQAGSTFALMFNCGGRVFVRQRSVGLMEITGTTMSLVPNSTVFATMRLMGMLALDKNSFLLLTSDQGFIRMDNATTTNPVFDFFTITNDTFLTTSGVLGIEWINDREFGVFSRQGLMIYNKDFTEKVFFNKKSGLKDETISEIFVDREKNIWIAHNNGCSMISYTTPALFYNESYGFGGTLEVMAFAGDTMYLGTSEGVYRSLNTSSQNVLSFTRLNDIVTEAWNILITGPSIIVSSSSGVYETMGDKTTQVSDHYTNSTLWIDTNRTLIAGEKGGFTVFSVGAERNWSVARHFELPATELIRISRPLPVKGRENTYSFTAITRFKTAVIIEFNYVDSSMHVRELGPKNGLPQDDCIPLQIGDTVYYFSYLAAYRYFPELDKNDSSFCVGSASDIYELVMSGHTEQIRNDVHYRLFLERPWIEATTTFFGNVGGKTISERVLLGELFEGRNIQFGQVVQPATVWMLNQETVVRYDLNTPLDTSLDYDAIITRVRFAGDSSMYNYPDREFTVPYSHNSVIINFAAPFFMYDMGSSYRYQLLGYDTAWSGKTRTPEKEYTNLPEGTYTFVVEAANPFAMQSTQARLIFTVLPPWYRTTWAYCIYVIGFILFVYIAVRVSARTLRKQKERLEEIVTERTAEVVEQKHKIEKQNLDLEEAYTGIQDSIVYSQRIQNAILPTGEEIKRIVPESFVLFFPRDIVSGDFYWFAEKAGVKYIACVDCTGHGVPGALMSMIGNTLLNQIILEKNISNPAEILNNLHRGVRHALKQDAGGDTRDGMDLAVIVLDENNSSLNYAGAYRALWIVRNNEMKETKADKFPIAGSQQEEERRFTSHIVPLQKGDVIYLTTDGYADQFGGPRGKKFMVKQLTRVLLDIHAKPMQEQKLIMERSFFAWKSDHEQVDDVLVIGIKI